MREKLIELLSQVQYQGNAVHGYHDKYILNSELADHLIANGVTIRKKSQKAKPRKRKHKAITIETMTALEAMGRKAHGGE